MNDSTPPVEQKIDPASTGSTNPEPVQRLSRAERRRRLRAFAKIQKRPNSEIAKRFRKLQEHLIAQARKSEATTQQTENKDATVLPDVQGDGTPASEPSR